MMNRLTIVTAVLVSIVFVGCTSHEMPKEKVDPDSIYFDYLVWGDEESGRITVKLQYRAGGPNETAVLLKEPARVEFDGEIISPDSTKFNGPYYEVIRPVKDFEGLHQIVFTDDKAKKSITEFSFRVVSLKTPVPNVIRRDNLVFELEGLKPGNKLRILLTDTSFYGKGIEKIDTTINGRIKLTNDELSVLKNGPIHLEILLEEERFSKKTMLPRGRFYLTYGLKREFILEDSISRQ